MAILLDLNALFHLYLKILFSTGVAIIIVLQTLKGLKGYSLPLGDLLGKVFFIAGIAVYGEHARPAELQAVVRLNSCLAVAFCFGVFAAIIYLFMARHEKVFRLAAVSTEVVFWIAFFLALAGGCYLAGWATGLQFSGRESRYWIFFYGSFLFVFVFLSIFLCSFILIIWPHLTKKTRMAKEASVFFSQSLRHFFARKKMAPGG